MEFTVKRSEWFRGKGDKESKLLREDGLKCCVGFFCIAGGLTPDDILNRTVITDTGRFGGALVAPHPRNVDRPNQDVMGQIYEINDDEDIGDDERETKLAMLFRKLGHEVKFVGPTA